MLAVKLFVRFGRDILMSKIGRRPIELGGVHVEVSGQDISYKGSLASGVYVLPALLKAEVVNTELFIKPAQGALDVNREWGLHRALLANKIKGADKGFEQQVNIVGLGYKAVKAKDGLDFSLGYSHKIQFSLPANVTVDIDKTGQILMIKSIDKELLGLICSRICRLRPVEPYKGTGIHCLGDHIHRKAGKSSAK